MSARAKPAGRAGRAQRGFSLVEVLVAMTIVSVSLVLVFEIVARNARTEALVKHRAAALRLAESLLDEPLSIGRERGGSNGFQWVRTVRDTTTPNPPGAAAEAATRLLAVEVEVTWARTPAGVRLATTRLWVPP